MKQLIAQLEQQTAGQELGTSYVPENVTARQLYTSLGFVENDERHGGRELVAVLPLKVAGSTA